MTGQRHNPRECWCGIDHGRATEAVHKPSPTCKCDVCALVRRTLATFKPQRNRLL